MIARPQFAGSASRASAALGNLDLTRILTLRLPVLRGIYRKLQCRGRCRRTVSCRPARSPGKKSLVGDICTVSVAATRPAATSQRLTVGMPSNADTSVLSSGVNATNVTNFLGPRRVNRSARVATSQSSNGPISPARGDRLAIGGESDGPDRPVMSFQSGAGDTLCDVPQHHETVAAGRGDRTAVRGKRRSIGSRLTGLSASGPRARRPIRTSSAPVRRPSPETGCRG